MRGAAGPVLLQPHGLSHPSPGAVQPAGEVPPAPHRLHQPAAAGAGAPVQAQQVPVSAQTLRGGHLTDAHGDSGTVHTPHPLPACSSLPGTLSLCSPHPGPPRAPGAAPIDLQGVDSHLPSGFLCLGLIQLLLVGPGIFTRTHTHSRTHPVWKQVVSPQAILEQFCSFREERGGGIEIQQWAA